MTNERDPGQIADQPHQPPELQRPPRRLIRFALGTLAATAALSIYTTATDTEAPWSLKLGDRDPRTELVTLQHSPNIIPGKVATEIVPGPTTRLDLYGDYSADFEAGTLDQAQQANLQDFANDILALLDDPKTKQIDVVIMGLSSDESRADAVNNDANLGKPSLNNQQLAENRAAFARNVLEPLIKDGRVSLRQVGLEQLLTQKEIATIDTIAAQFGLSRAEFMTSYNQNLLPLSAKEQDFMSDVIDQNRGISITSSVMKEQLPITVGACDIVVQEIPVEDTIIERRDPGSNGLIITLLPCYIPRLRRRKTAPNQAPPVSKIIPDQTSKKTTGSEESSTANMNADDPTKAKISPESPATIPSDYSFGSAGDPLGRIPSPRVRPTSDNLPPFRPNTTKQPTGRGKKIVRWILPKAALVGVLAIVPIPGCDTVTQSRPDISSPCRNIDYRDGVVRTATIITGLEVASNLLSSRKWNDGTHRTIYHTVRAKTVTSLPERRRILVDANGRIQKITTIPTRVFVQVGHPSYPSQ